MAEIKIEDLTTKAINGTGVFDCLMSSLELRVQQEYRDNRITGNDYATVFLGGLQSVLQQSVQFLIQKQGADKNAELADAQIEKTKKETDVLSKELEMMDQQILKLQAEVDLAEQQVAISIVQEQNLKEEQKKIIAETSLINQNLANAITSNTNLLKQQSKLESESALLRQKLLSERSQIEDTINGKKVVGVIGAQKALSAAQQEGFKRDAEQKLAKIVLDTWSVRRSTDEGTIAPTGIADADITEIMTVAKKGIR